MRALIATNTTSGKEIKDMLITLKWSEAVAKTVSEDKIDNKDLLPSLTKATITTLYSITRKGHKVLIIAEDHLKLAMYWVQHQIRIS